MDRIPECNSCGKEIDDIQAAASIFDLSFLPGPDGKVSRAHARCRAARIGPLCPKCQKTPTTLPRPNRKKRSRVSHGIS